MVRLTEKAAKSFARLLFERASLAFAESAATNLGTVFAQWVQARVLDDDVDPVDPPHIGDEEE